MSISPDKLNIDEFKAGLAFGISKRANWFGNTLSTINNANLSIINPMAGVLNTAKPMLDNSALGKEYINPAIKGVQTAAKSSWNPMNLAHGALAGIEGNRQGQTLAPFESKGISFNKDQYGRIDSSQGVGGVDLGKTMGNFGNAISNWAKTNWGQFKDAPMDWIKSNPWTAGGIGAGLLGAGYMAGNMLFGGGNKQPTQQAPAITINNSPTGQTTSNSYHGANPNQTFAKFGSAFDMPIMVANRLVAPNESFQQPAVSPQPSSPPQIITDDDRLKKLLANPRMRDYILSLAQYGQK